MIQPECSDFPVNIGGSVAIDGICLTLEQWNGSAMCFSAVKETLKKTTLSSAKTGQKINLERATQLGNRLDGHLVYGHVDDVGFILKDQKLNGSTMRTITVPEALSPFMAEKGSVAIDGISLTIAQTDSNSITLSLIPHTLKMTTLAEKHAGDSVNIECDIIARYLQHLSSLQHTGLSHPPAQESILSTMERSGF